jgi:hypothetical protein
VENTGCISEVADVVAAILLVRVIAVSKVALELGAVVIDNNENVRVGGAGRCMADSYWNVLILPLALAVVSCERGRRHEGPEY